jgi:primosomal replication protein N''
MRPANNPRDFLQAYLDYAAKARNGAFGALRDTTARLIGKAGSSSPGMSDSGVTDGLVQSVADYLRSIGHTPTPGDDARDAFRVDFAIVDKTTSLFGIGIECDMPNHLLLARARAREIWRPRVLGRAVPAVHRVSVNEWYQRPQHERDRLRGAVEQAVGKGAAA